MEKPYLYVKDIKKIFDVGTTKAYQIMDYVLNKRDDRGHLIAKIDPYDPIKTKKVPSSALLQVYPELRKSHLPQMEQRE